MFRELALVCIIVAIIMTGLGGMLDITRRQRFAGLTKTHLWNDGIFLLLLANAFLLLERSA